MPNKLSISEILKSVSELKSEKERIKVLQENDSHVLRNLLWLAFNKDVVWLLPEGTPPFNKNNVPGAQGNLYNQWKRLNYFFPGTGYDGMNKIRREQIFIQFLESLDGHDADLICAVKDKKMPYKFVTKNLISKAFPDLFPVEKTDA